MAYEANSGLQVVNHYGPRETGGSVGVETTRGSIHNLSFEFTGQSLKEGWVPPFVFPKYAQVLRAYVTVDQAFQGLTTVSVGEGNDEATNGITLAAADLAVGTRDVSTKLAGEWETTASTTKASQIGIAVTGAVAPTVGKASLVIEFIYKRRNDNDRAVDPDTKPAYRPQA